jgi:hypothetical protein
MPENAKAKAPPGAWNATQRKQATRHVVPRLSALRREPKCNVSQRGFFHSNNNFLKFFNDDNNNYTLKILMKIIIFTIQIIIFLVAII